MNNTIFISPHIIGVNQPPAPASPLWLISCDSARICFCGAPRGAGLPAVGARRWAGRGGLNGLGGVTSGAFRNGSQSG